MCLKPLRSLGWLRREVILLAPGLFCLLISSAICQFWLTFSEQSFFFSQTIMVIVGGYCTILGQISEESELSHKQTALAKYLLCCLLKDFYAFYWFACPFCPFNKPLNVAQRT